ncbi:MAG: hypothetical protein QRY72_05530 [Candidatus Rhabdochlamydia sp.]
MIHIPLLYPPLSTYRPIYESYSLTECGVLWILSHNQLNPCAYQPRTVTNLSSLKESLAQADFDIFERRPNPDFKTGTLISEWIKVRRAVALLGFITLAAPLGFVWHLGNWSYHQIFHPSSNPLKPLVCELKWSIIFCCSLGLVIQLVKVVAISAKIFFIRPLEHLPQALATLLVTIGSLRIISQLVCTFVKLFIESPLSLRLKEKMGIVGENGWLLVSHDNKKSDHEQLEHYLQALHLEKAVMMILEFRTLLSKYYNSISKDHLEKLCDQPQEFLRGLYDQFTPDQKQVLDVYRNEAEQIVNDYCLAKEIVGDFVSSYDQFPLNSELCSQLFSDYLEPQSTLEYTALLKQFSKQLVTLKQSDILSEDNSESLFTLRQKFLNVNAPNQVLQVTHATSRKVQMHKYAQLISHINLMQDPKELSPLAADLLLFMDTAYRICIYQMPPDFDQDQVAGD